MRRFVGPDTVASWRTIGAYREWITAQVLGACLLLACCSGCNRSTVDCALQDEGRWVTTPLVLQVAPSPKGATITQSDLLAAMQEAAQRWGQLPLHVEGAREVRRVLVAEDGYNSLGLVRDLQPGNSLFGEPHAVTHLYRRKGGQIVEADIELDINSPLWGKAFDATAQTTAQNCAGDADSADADRPGAGCDPQGAADSTDAARESSNLREFTPT